MGWSAAITTLVLDDVIPVPRSWLLEMRNGYFAATGLAWASIPIGKDSWSIEQQDGNPCVGHMRVEIPTEDYTYMDEFDKLNPVMLFTEGRVSCTITTAVGVTETEWMFEGKIRTIDKVDLNIVIDIVGPMEKLKTSLAPLEMEALKSPATGFHADVQLRHEATGIFDDPGTEYTFEIDPDWPGVGGQAWCEDVFGGNRSWVPHAFVLEEFVGAVWVGIEPSEYIIDTANGLIFFSNDQIGNTFHLKEVAVYIEGTLEVADVIQEMLAIPNICPSDPSDRVLGCGFTQAQLTVNLTGVLTFVGGTVLTGAGTLFLTELEVGERIALHAASPIMAVVASVTDNNNAVLKYPYENLGGTPGAFGAAFKSTLMESGVSITNIKWSKCQGTAADLYRVLQTNYADSKGYKIWYDYVEGTVVGKQVRALDPDVPAEAAKIILLPQVLKNGLKVQSTTEDFGSAVASTGVIGKPVNLITQPGITITDLSLALPPVGGFSWLVGPSTGGAPQTWYGLTYCVATSCLNDINTSSGYASYHDYPDFPTRETALNSYFDFILIDLLAVFDLSTIVLYRINSRLSRQNETMGVDVYGSVDGVTYNPISPEAIHYEMAHDEVKEFSIEGISARYIKIKCRPMYWVDGGKELTMGFREIIIYGSQELCTIACIQDQIAHGVRQAGAGTITFAAGGPPWLVNGIGTSFGVVGHPGVGDYIALNADLDHWGFILQVISPTQVWLWYEYGAATPVGPGAYKWSDGTGPYEEGEGGHFIGTSKLDSTFIRDYYAHLFNKMFAYGHRTIRDEEAPVVTEAQAMDRAYIILNEVIRVYRMIRSTHPFDVRVKMFDTVHVLDDYRVSGHEHLYYLVQGIKYSDANANFAGTEFGAGVLE